MCREKMLQPATTSPTISNNKSISDVFQAGTRMHFVPHPFLLLVEFLYIASLYRQLRNTGMLEKKMKVLYSHSVNDEKEYLATWDNFYNILLSKKKVSIQHVNYPHYINIDTCTHTGKETKSVRQKRNHVVRL